MARVNSYNSPKSSTKLWRYDFTDHRGRRSRLGNFRSKEDAANALAIRSLNDQRRRHGIAVTDESLVPRVTIKELFARILKRRQHEGRSLRTPARYTFNRFNRMARKDLLVRDVRAQDLLTYQDARLEQVKPQTVAREMTDICAALNRAHELFAELVDYAPPRRPRLNVPNSARSRVISHTEARRLIAHLRRPHETEKCRREKIRRTAEDIRSYFLRLDHADALHIALQTSARSSEVRRLKWSDFNPHFKTLRRIQTKTGNTPVIVPLNDTLVRMLLARQARLRAHNIIESEYIFPSPRDSSRPRSVFEHRVIRRACEELGIPYGRFTAGGLVFHDTRHTAVTNLIDSGASIPTAQSITGHGSRYMLLTYAHAMTDSTRTAVAALADLGESGNHESDSSVQMSKS
ncbi:MAG: site-specific integrase [Pyrinomonadaceae bacterium MAG19_C2-C3]|nr:site-specific integrase [Pyrinomonadaceae bacterium MAG19_C2-C3]